MISYHASQASPCKRNSRPTSTKIPAAPPMTAPRASDLTFTVISVFASSISSRISSCALTEPSWIAWAIFWSESVSAGKALEDHREHNAAGEGGTDDGLGALGERRGVRQAVRPRRRLVAERRRRRRAGRGEGRRGVLVDR